MAEHTREFESFGRNLKIAQDDRELGCTVWDSSMVLAKYFENTTIFGPSIFTNINVLELGSGCGLVGIVLALLGAKVTFTDFNDQAIELIRLNVRENNVPSARIRIEKLDWRDISGAKQLVEEVGPFSLVIGADLAYDEKYFSALVKTLDACVCSGQGEDGLSQCILAHELRHRREGEFFRMLKEIFSLEKVPLSDLDPVFSSPDIGVFRLSKL